MTTYVVDILYTIVFIIIIVFFFSFLKRLTRQKKIPFFSLYGRYILFTAIKRIIIIFNPVLKSLSLGIKCGVKHTHPHTQAHR